MAEKPKEKVVDPDALSDSEDEKERLRKLRLREEWSSEDSEEEGKGMVCI